MRIPKNKEDKSVNSNYLIVASTIITWYLLALYMTGII